MSKLSLPLARPAQSRLQSNQSCLTRTNSSLGWARIHLKTASLATRGVGMASSAGSASIAGSLALSKQRLQEKAPAILAQQEQNPHFQLIRQLQEEVAERVADAFSLRPHVSPGVTDDEGVATFASADSSTCFVVQTYEGTSSGADGKPDAVCWMNKPYLVAGPFTCGGRVNVFLGDSTYVPNLDIEIYHYPPVGKLFVYLNLVPRRDLIASASDDAKAGDLEQFYMSAGAAGGKSLHDLYLECEGDELWEAFRTKSAYVRALTGSTCLMYQTAATPEGGEAVAKLTRQVADLWFGFATGPSAPQPASEEEKAALRARDARLLAYAKLDPDNRKIAPLIGEQAMDQMLALLTAEGVSF